MAFAGAWLLCLLLALPSAYGQDAFFQSGVASWYGPWHHGKSTATGEAFDMFAMTAAHRTLPLGTLVKVENKASGKSVIVRINDRGPYSKNRIIDLSYAAADSLGLSETGVSRVTLEIVGNREGYPLLRSQAFFVKLAETQVSSDAVAQQLRRLICLGMYDAASLLHTRDGVMAIGPYDSFQESQDALVRVATTHPGASIMLAEKNSMAPAVQAVADNTMFPPHKDVQHSTGTIFFPASACRKPIKKPPGLPAQGQARIVWRRLSRAAGRSVFPGRTPTFRPRPERPEPWSFSPQA